MNTDSKMIVICGLGAVVSICWLSYRKKSTVPALVGSKGIISSYMAALHMLRNAAEVITEGYYKDRSAVFRFPTLFRWDYVATGKKHVLEIAAAPEHILSFNEAAADSLQSDWTMGPQITKNPYHVSAVRGQLTRNLGLCFPQVRDEIIHSFDHVLGLDDKEWKLIKVLPTTMQVIARTTNRLFVGLPLCRKPEYLQLNIDYTVTIFTRGQLIGLIPEFLKPIFSPLFSTRKSSLRHALKFLAPLLDERLENENQFGSDWPDRPNDMISWLLDLAEGEERTTPALASRILAVNMAAIHTSSTTLTSALYDLVTYPEHILPMREEVERVIAAEGWSKAAIGNMHKIDSFLRESQRLRGAAPIAMLRKVVAPDGFTFSDGTMIPFNAFLSVVGNAAHCDPANYDHADQFDGFRFSRLREEHEGPVGNDDADEGGTMFNHHMVSTTSSHVVFGHGRHACPGRFFVATELKAMMAHMLINYDIKAEREGVRPPDMFFKMLRMPSPEGKIWIRKRERI